MAKTNYTKMEEVLRDELQKITANKLREAAPSLKNDLASSLSQKQSQILASLQIELKYLYKQGHNIYERLKIDKGWMKELIENRSKLTDEEWQKVLQTKEGIKKFKKELEDKPAEEINANIVQQERHKHLTKRHNVNEKWLPLKG